MSCVLHWGAMQRIPEALESFLYHLISPILLCKTTPPQRHPALSTSVLSDDDIAHLTISSPKVDEGAYINPLTGTPDLGNVAKIASDTVVKQAMSTGIHERLSAELVRRYTAIPVPIYERVFCRFPQSYAVQQYIPGRVLLDAWPDLGLWTRLRVYVTLRFYIRELRALSSRSGPPPFPGPPSEDDTPRKCTGRLFNESGSGPFRSYREMSRWYQNQLLVMQHLYNEGMDSAQFDDSSPLVFTHMDLHPRNMILGDDGQLWIVDWADAGWYPPWFEAASMTLFTRYRRDIPSSWTSWIPFIASICAKPGQLPFIDAISYTLVVLGADVKNLVGGICQVLSKS